jgi:hypothetical protein
MKFIAKGGRTAVLLVVGSLGLMGGAALAQPDAQIRDRIVQRSIDSYSGNCPCPYSRASNGSRCGGRSAYSRPGGQSPICYANEVTAADIRAYRGR